MTFSTKLTRGLKNKFPEASTIWRSLMLWFRSREEFKTSTVCFIMDTFGQTFQLVSLGCLKHFKDVHPSYFLQSGSTKFYKEMYFFDKNKFRSTWKSLFNLIQITDSCLK